MTKKKLSKRILNCIPSRDTQNDWTIATARGAGLLAAPNNSREQRLTRKLVAAWRSKFKRSLHRLGDGRWFSSMAFREAGRLVKIQLLSPRFIWMAAKERDEFTNIPTTFIRPMEPV